MREREKEVCISACERDWVGQLAGFQDICRLKVEIEQGRNETIDDRRTGET